MCKPTAFACVTVKFWGGTTNLHYYEFFLAEYYLSRTKQNFKSIDSITSEYTSWYSWSPRYYNYEPTACACTVLCMWGWPRATRKRKGSRLAHAHTVLLANLACITCSTHLATAYTSSQLQLVVLVVRVFQLCLANYGQLAARLRQHLAASLRYTKLLTVLQFQLYQC